MIARLYKAKKEAKEGCWPSPMGAMKTEGEEFQKSGWGNGWWMEMAMVRREEVIDSR